MGRLCRVRIQRRKLTPVGVGREQRRKGWGRKPKEMGGAGDPGEGLGEVNLDGAWTHIILVSGGRGVSGKRT